MYLTHVQKPTKAIFPCYVYNFRWFSTYLTIRTVISGNGCQRFQARSRVRVRCKGMPNKILIFHNPVSKKFNHSLY